MRVGRSMKVLLAGVLVFHAGWYLLLPFFAVLFTTRRGLSGAQAGMVLAMQSLFLLLGSIGGGFLADRLGRRLTLTMGLVVRAVGIGAFAAQGGVWYFAAVAAVAGFGGGLYAPAAKAGIAVLAEGSDQATVFSWRGIAASIGTSVGPLLGAFLVRGPMPVIFLVSAGLHLVLAVATWTLVTEHPVQQRPGRQPLREVLTDVPFVLFLLVTGLAWALFTQLSISVPLFASRVLGLEALIGLLFTVTSLTVILLQVPVTRYLVSHLRPLTAMAAGVALMGVGFGLISFATGFGGLVAAALVFVLGEMFVMPTADAAVTAMARPGAVGSYFGMATLAWGFGEAMGNLGGGSLMAYALGRGLLRLPWALYLMIGLATGLLYWLLGRWVAARGRPSPAGRIQIFAPGVPSVTAKLHVGPADDEP